MRISETNFILIPEWLAPCGGTGPDADHWISRWQRSIASAQWLETGECPPEIALISQCAASTRPTVIITHGHGVEVLLTTAEAPTKTPIAGAFIVAPSFADDQLANAVSLERVPLAFPSVIVAPDDHPVVPTETAESFAQNLGGHYVAAGAAGRLDAQSGHGPWPDGLMRLGWFLKRLSAH